MSRATAPPEAETLALVARVQAGELGAFNTLVVRHQDAAYSLAYRFMGSRQGAEDATQEAFLRAYSHIDSFRGERFRSWLLSIVANACRDELRKRRRRPQRSLDQARRDSDRPELDPSDEGPSPEDALLNADLRVALERALLQLPEEWRLVVVLADVHGLAYEEVARAAQIPLGTVKSRLARARGRLRDILTATGELPPASRRRTE